MVSRAKPSTSALTGTKLRDFEIQAAAELGLCAGAQSFRAVRRCDATPVLLHKFRPAQSLLELGPILDLPEPPDFAGPFMTRFTDLFAAAGSAYLIEPLPDCFSLAEVWRHVLLNRPHQAHTVTTTLTRHLLLLVRELTGQGRCHGALSVENIVLTSTGNFGALAGGIKCEEGLLWLRKDPEEPSTDDHSALAEVLRSLLDIEEELASLRNASVLLCPEMREGILYLAHAVEQSRRCAKAG
jgi:hypothetical protein